MTDRSDIERLEARIHELEAEQDVLRSQVTRAQLDQWQGRIDDLEVQVHLGALELGDRLDPLLEALRNRWLDAVQQVSDGSSTAGETFDALRAGLDDAMRDLRQAIVNAKDVAIS